MLALEWLLLFLMLGSVVGFIAGLLGVGGGGIIVPILTSIFLLQGMPVDKVMHLALGTSMACIIVTSIASLRAHHKKEAVMWGVVKNMSVGLMLGTFLSTFVASYLHSFFLAMVFTLFMVFTGIKMMRKQPLQSTNKPLNKGSLIFASTGIGAISALVSIGGGSISVPYLVARNIDIKKAIGTSAAIGLPISLAGTVGYLINGWAENSTDNFTLGYIYLPAFVLISVASFFTAPYGVKASHNLPVKVLKKMFALLLIILSIKMLLSVA